ncbi:MAG: phospho-N-acetylmuramoyl-pentapeptide-transferase, partial [Desulfurobacterium sp.]
MLYFIFFKIFGINIFKYITFRSIYASITAMVLGFFLFPKFKEKLKDFQFRQSIKEYLPETHKLKRSIPTMGGVLILSLLLLSSLLWNRLDNRFVILSLLSASGFGIIGFIDDYIKSRMGKAEGLSERWKFLLQVLVALLVAFSLYRLGFSTKIYFPVFKNLSVDLGIFFILWATFIIVGSSNAVNL